LSTVALHFHTPTRGEPNISLRETVSRQEWIRARVALLKHENATTKARDELAAERRRYWVAEDYRFATADGRSRTLLDLSEAVGS
jgi:predicted dithiol-disulfide oxidoreductase (DUF899 family)